ncbi:MAG: hypothetical protein FWH37_00370 [Candidatus Bathyarchaeota archaeon]|nr:hypothetical protein [Candidatus Termiticorpusculum sp.]
MSIEQFNVQSPPPALLNDFIIGLIVIGAVLLVLNVLMYNRLKNSPLHVGIGIGVGIGGTKYALAIWGIALIILGGFLYGISVAASSPSVVTIGEGYIKVESGFVGGGINKNVASEEIATAFVGQVGSGDFTLRKNLGTDFGDTNIGRYTLGNGASAYVVTTNVTCLIIELKYGEYIIR